MSDKAHKFALTKERAFLVKPQKCGPQQLYSNLPKKKKKHNYSNNMLLFWPMQHFPHRTGCKLIWIYLTNKKYKYFKNIHIRVCRFKKNISRTFGYIRPLESNANNGTKWPVCRVIIILYMFSFKILILIFFILK